MKTQEKRLEHYIKAKITQFFSAIHICRLLCLVLILHAYHKLFCNRKKGKKNDYCVSLVPVLSFHEICGCVRLVTEILSEPQGA